MNTIEQAREVSKRLRYGAYVDGRDLQAADTIDTLLAELERLKSQEPVGYAYANQDFLGSVIGAKGEWAPHEIALYTAAGAQPVPEVTKDSIRAAGGTRYAYTEAQLRDYGDHRAMAERERAARVCEAHASDADRAAENTYDAEGYKYFIGKAAGAVFCAEAIRKGEKS